jgi:hypothetical protein
MAVPAVSGADQQPGRPHQRRRLPTDPFVRHTVPGRTVPTFGPSTVSAGQGSRFGDIVGNRNRKGVGAALAAGAAVVVAATALAAPAGASANPEKESVVKVDFATADVSPDLAVHDTDSLLAFIGSDQAKTVTIDTSRNAVTTVTD